MAEQIRIAGQVHILAFCEVTVTPEEGQNKGIPFVVTRRTGFNLDGNAGSIYLPGPDGSPLGVGVGTTEPKWSLDTELEQTRQLQKHIGGGDGAGYRFVHFTMTFSHRAPNRALITDVAEGCLLLEDPTTGKSGENTVITIGGPATKVKPNGIDPMDARAALG